MNKHKIVSFLSSVVLDNKHSNSIIVLQSVFILLSRWWLSQENHMGRRS